MGELSTKKEAYNLNGNVKARGLFKADWQKMRNLDTSKVDRVCLADDKPSTKVPATVNKWIEGSVFATGRSADNSYPNCLN